MRDLAFLRRAVLAGGLALSGLAASATVEATQAMPAAALAAPAGSGLTDVQYYRYHRYRHYRGRRAGLYRCGPGALHTRLERSACGVTSPSRQFLYHR